MRRASLLALLSISLISTSRVWGAPGNTLDSERMFLLDLSRIQWDPSKDLPSPGFFQTQPAEPSHEEAYQLVWAHLKDSNVPENFVKDAFDLSKTEIVQEVVDRFNKPVEKLPYSEYRKFFMTEKNIQQGAEFYAGNGPLLESVRARFGVDPFLLAGLVGVETRYGQFPGKLQVFNCLYTIVRKIPRRSNWAANELAEFLKLSYPLHIEPHAINGSYAGAFGYYQFMPSSYNQYAVDFDGDGQRSWDKWPDVFASVANFLKEHGYQTGGDITPGSPIWKSILSYNPSEYYACVVTELRQAIQSRTPAKKLNPHPFNESATRSEVCN